MSVNSTNLIYLGIDNDLQVYSRRTLSRRINETSKFYGHWVLI